MEAPTASIAAIEYYLPETTLTNEMLVQEYPDWTVEKVAAKTGIHERRIAAPGECSSDLAVKAAEKLFAAGAAKPADIDYLLFCTQSPDYFLPTTACLLQERLGLPRSVGALDFNLGCSGFVYGLSLAKGLIETGQARNVLLLTAETYSKFIHPADRSVRTIFGDGAAATLISAVESTAWPGPAIGPFVFGTDGQGACNLIVGTGGMRRPASERRGDLPACPASDAPNPDYLFMDGAEIFSFTLAAVPRAVRELLAASGKQLSDIDLFVFHQANQHMLEHLRAKLKIPPERFSICLKRCGNTVSSTIPITLHEAVRDGTLRPGHLVMLVGFGVGYSWAATLVRWR